MKVYVGRAKIPPAIAALIVPVGEEHRAARDMDVVVVARTKAHATEMLDALDVRYGGRLGSEPPGRWLSVYSGGNDVRMLNDAGIVDTETAGCWFYLGAIKSRAIAESVDGTLHRAGHFDRDESGRGLAAVRDAARPGTVEA